MEITDSSQRLGQPSRLTHISSAYPIVLPGSKQHLAHPELPQLPLLDCLNEKADPALYQPSNHAVPSGCPQQSRPHHPSCIFPATSIHYSRTAPTQAYTRPRGLRIANLLKPWTPIILYAITSFGFLAVIALWKAEVFQGLDDLSHWLKSDEYVGYAAIFMLIFITTFPPIPLYSTLIILSGYTYGAWTGAVISYGASLAGALTVFIISRTFFRASIAHWLSCSLTIKRVVRAIEKRPKLLFLIRLAPYPYNVMNCLLAASPTLTLRTYTLCTALSLFKLIIHTSIGSSIHSFAQYHVVKPGEAAPAQGAESTLGHYSTIAGVVLCIVIFFYLSYVARKAVDEELEDDIVLPRDSEETLAFLSDQECSGREMEEVLETRPASRTGDRFICGGLEEASIGLR